MWTLTFTAVCIAALSIGMLIGSIAGSRWLGVWVMGKLLQRELTRKRREQ
jgi:hypothetical protein